ncbi:MAG: carboxypeptidase regulatory-like domain-containing protein [Nitrososphaerota archaeon]|nr:carboxypeptidase regulatory-like domain-containing protein [Candidatus Calditenuaceae archaeon]MDW8072636.1 carboxypeptidase regulatory-like domain-containing protein [Nitrososphaerota archaeon]
MRAVVLLLALLVILSSLLVVKAQEQSLRVTVLDPSGTPRAGVELTLSNSTFTRLFETTSQGIAEFRLLSPGTYNISARIEGVEVASATVTFPAQTRLNLTLKIQSIELFLNDLDGRPASGVSIELRSENGPVIRRGTTDMNGRFFAKDLPLSSLPQVGPYRVVGRLGAAPVLNSTINVAQNVTEHRLPADIVKVGVSVLDFRGRPVNATLRLSSESFNFSTSIEAGKMASIPSSRVTGQYVVEALKRYLPQGQEILLLKEVTSLERSQNLTYVLDLSDLLVSVTDDAGAPVHGVRILIESDRLGLVGSTVTGAAGDVSFTAIPLSEGRPGAGTYRVTALKDGVQLGSLTINLSPGVERITFPLNRVDIVFRLEGPGGKTVSNATLTLKDPVTGRSYTAVSDEAGGAVVKLFPGVHEYSVSFMGVSLSKGEVNATVSEVSIAVRGVDVEFRVRVRDWAGNVLRNADVSAVWRGKPLEMEKLEDGTFLTRIPVAGEVQVDVYLDGALAERRLIWVDSPTLFEVRLRGVLMGSRLVDLETISSLVAAILLAISASSIVVLWRKRISSK